MLSAMNEGERKQRPTSSVTAFRDCRLHPAANGFFILGKTPS